MYSDTIPAVGAHLIPRLDRNHRIGTGIGAMCMYIGKRREVPHIIYRQVAQGRIRFRPKDGTAKSCARPAKVP